MQDPKITKAERDGGGWDDEIEPPIKDVKLRKHQRKAFRLAMENGGTYGFLHEMGCGKTLTAISVMGTLHQQCGVNKVLVVCPMAVYSAWVNDMERLDVPGVDPKIIKGTAANKAKQLKYWRGKLQVAIINYESFWRKDVAEAIAKWNPDMVILDEAHKIKAWNTSQSKGAHKLGDITPHKLLLTGTPIANSPLDAWSQYRFLDKTVYGTSWYAFKNTYAVIEKKPLRGGGSYPKLLGYRNMESFKEKLHSIAHKVSKEECLDLPEAIDIYRDVELEREARDVYDGVAREMIAEIEDGVITASNVLVKSLKLSRITGGYCDVEKEGATELKQVSKAKINALVEVLDELGPDKKICIFARFTAEINAIHELLLKRYAAEQIVTMTGSTPADERLGNIDKFQTDGGCKVFLANIQCAGLGITLTASDTMIFYSFGYSMTDYEQAKARIHRIGQKNACTYIHLIVTNSIDNTVREAVERKKNVAEEILKYVKGGIENDKQTA
ncbi:MAG: DEAD/DEAH box helicase [Clostridiales bacterium]|nr:DEAD/DEAH box helicase [Clostridiales bacterium]